MLRHGFVGESIRLLEGTTGASGCSRILRLQVLRDLADALLQAGRMGESEHVARRNAVETRGIPVREVGALHQVATAQMVGRKLDEAERTCRRMAEVAAAGWANVRSDADLALVARARGKIAKSVTMLREVGERHAGIPQMASWSLLEAAALLHALGRKAEAWKVLRDAQKRFPGALRAPHLRHLSYALSALDGDYTRACEILRVREEAARGDGIVDAALELLAGMLHALSGKGDAAQASWKRVAARYPPGGFRGVAEAAEHLARGEMAASVIDAVPLQQTMRSELLYWAGRVLESRGEHSAAAECMRRSAETDRTLRWPACLARRWLRESRRDARGRRGAGRRSRRRSRGDRRPTPSRRRA
jgi:tetratricopeptide (TPR) repeat protein